VAWPLQGRPPRRSSSSRRPSSSSPPSADLVSQACTNAARHFCRLQLSKDSCVSALRSDERSAAARDLRDLALVAVDLVRASDPAAAADAAILAAAARTRSAASSTAGWTTTTWRARCPTAAAWCRGTMPPRWRPTAAGRRHSTTSAAWTGCGTRPSDAGTRSGTGPSSRRRSGRRSATSSNEPTSPSSYRSKCWEWRTPSNHCMIN
jgi:hypothetical protein